MKKMSIVLISTFLAAVSAEKLVIPPASNMLNVTQMKPIGDVNSDGVQDLLVQGSNGVQNVHAIYSYLDKQYIQTINDANFSYDDVQFVNFGNEIGIISKNIIYSFANVNNSGTEKEESSPKPLEEKSNAQSTDVVNSNEVKKETK